MQLFFRLRPQFGLVHFLFLQRLEFAHDVFRRIRQCLGDRFQPILFVRDLGPCALERLGVFRLAGRQLVLGLIARFQRRVDPGLGLLPSLFRGLCLRLVLGYLLIRLGAGLLDVDISVAGSPNGLVEGFLELLGGAFRVQPERVGSGAHQDLLTDCQVFPDLELNFNIL